MAYRSRPLRNSISGKVSLGLGLMVVALGLVSLLSLYGFFSLNAGLDLLSKQSVPKIVEGAKVTSDINELLTETERLLAANNDPARRSSYSKITANIKVISEAVRRSSIADETMNSRIIALKETLSELNELVAARIEMTSQTEKAVGRLFSYAEELGAFKVESSRSSGNSASQDDVSNWNVVSMRIVNLAGKSVTLKSLYKVKRVRTELEKLFRELDRLSFLMPVQKREKAQILAKRLNGLVLEEAGVITLMTLQVETALQNSGRGNFARSLVDDTTSTLITTFNKQISGVSDRTNALTKQGNLLALTFSALSLVSFVIAALVVLFFQRKVIKRLTKLNATILARVAGRDVEIEQSGNDEITDMAQSFLFYENEVNLREAKLTDIAMKDVLTGAGNRRHFMQKGQDLIDLSSRFDHPLALMMLDIDHFKNVNDTYGHQAGDEVLKHVADVCKGILRSVDVFGRIGGEEFAAVLPETRIDQAVIVAERIRSEIAKEKSHFEGQDISCSVSIGVSHFQKDSGDGLEDLMKKADAALYEAKESGRNRVMKTA